jgi:Tfp pilus assembly protein PilP
MMRAPTPRISLPALALSVLVLLCVAGCAEKTQPPPPPVVKKVVPKEVAKAAEAPAAAAKPPAEERYNPKGKRDPFEPFIKPALKGGQDTAAVPPLQRYDIGELKFVGVIWTARGAHALVEDVAGKGYTVKVGTRIGRAGGIVTRITDGQLFIGEESRESTGARVVREFSLKLQTAGGQ